jgi:hypothetical protein
VYEDKELNPETWEEFIDQIYRIKYKDEGYQYIPARNDGDCGIEGYTETGKVYQCYFPEGEYSPNDLYEKLRDKLTKDIGKIQKNQDKLLKLGINNITEWHLVIPKYEDKRILEHAYTKEKEILKLKGEGKLSIIDDNFKVYIKELKDFTVEMNTLIKVNKEYKYLLPKIEEIDFSLCDSEKKANISRKIKTLRNNMDDEKTQKTINIFIEFYLKGIEMLNEIREHSPELYEQILKIENTYRTNMELKCNTNTDNAMNQKLFKEILDDFEEKLKEELGQLLSYSDIGELKQEMIGKWLADCPLDFVN